MPDKTEFIIEHREDSWNVPPETRILTVNCGLNLHSAQKIMEKCRVLERMIFAGHAYALTGQETKDYLSEQVFVEIKGDVQSHNLDTETVEKIEEMSRLWHHTSETIAEELGITSEQVKHVIQKKAPIE